MATDDPLRNVFPVDFNRIAANTRLPTTVNPAQVPEGINYGQLITGMAAAAQRRAQIQPVEPVPGSHLARLATGDMMFGGQLRAALEGIRANVRTATGAAGFTTPADQRAARTKRLTERRDRLTARIAKISGG
jgi:hypothetical protein